MKNIKLITITIIIALFAGFISGIFGFFIGKFYISNLSVVSNLYIPDQNEIGNKGIVIQEAKKVVVEQDDRVTQVINKAENSIFKIYKKKVLASSGINSFYSDNDFIAYASVVTSDGWIVTQSKTILDPQYIIGVDKNSSYRVTDIVVDPLTNLQFIKLDVSGLTVVDYAKASNINIGQTVLGYIPFDYSVVATYVKDNNFVQSSGVNNVKSIETDKQHILLGDKLGDDSSGLPVMSLNGEILGVSVGSDIAVKSSYINFLVKSLLKEGKIVKPYLGVSYINLSEFSGNHDLSLGYLVIKNSKVAAVSADSPLFSSLKEGDVIVGIEDQALTKGKDLADYLYEYSLGSTITFKIISQGEQKNISYTLTDK